MDFWLYFIVVAVVCAFMDKILGLAYVFYGLALLFLIIGLAGAAGVNILNYGYLVEVFVIIIFTPFSSDFFSW